MPVVQLLTVKLKENLKRLQYPILSNSTLFCSIIKD